MHGQSTQSGGAGEAAAPGPQAPQGAPETAAKPPALPQGATPAERMRASLAAAKREAGAGEGPVKPAEAAAPGEPEDPVEAKVAEVAKRLEAKRAQAAAEQAAKQETAEAVAARLDPQLLRSEKGRDHLQAWARAQGVDPLELFDALAELGEEHEREAKANPLDKRVTTLEKEREAEAQRKAAEAKAVREAGAREAFLGSVTADKFPLLSALDEDEIMARGIAAARVLTKAGEEPDAETIAALAEVELRKLHSKLAAKGGESKKAGSAEPRTLSSSLGGETPEPPKFLGKDGPRQRMTAHLRARG